MKKKNLFFAILVSSCIISCDSFLDKKPWGQISSDLTWSTEDINKATIGAYDPIGWEYYDFTNTYVMDWFFGDIASDDATKGGANNGDIAALYDIDNFLSLSTANSILQSYYKVQYEGISRANLVIQQSKLSNITDEYAPGKKLVDRLKGEAMFLRAYYYFQLVKVYGGVPLVTEPVSPEDKRPRSSKSEIYSQIEKDLRTAAQLLPEKSDYSNNDLGRATKGAALSYLAKAFLYEEKWDSAYYYSDKVIKSNQYSLFPKQWDNFMLANENGVESIFEIQHFNNVSDNNGWVIYNEGNITNTMQSPRNDEFTKPYLLPKNYQGYGFNIPTISLKNEFETGDPRKWNTIIFNGDTIEDMVMKFKTQYSSTLMHAKKYYKFKDVINQTGLNNRNGKSNIHVFRYADLLLMAAEASYHLGNESVSKIYLEQVRNRAREGKSILPYVAASGVQLLDAIKHERRVELALEGHRFYDLVRWGDAPSKINNFESGKNEVFPIPQVEIDYSAGIIKQNPNY